MTKENSYFFKRACSIKLNSLKKDKSGWLCCGHSYSEKPSIYQHITSLHKEDIFNLASQCQQSNISKNESPPLSSKRVHKWQSDPISTQCECDLTKGTVILFYQYSNIGSTSGMLNNLRKLLHTNNFSGKIRVSSEGINGTLAGKRNDVFSILPSLYAEIKQLDDNSLPPSPSVLKQYFKPSPTGCIHLFPNLSIRAVSEVVPTGLEGYEIDFSQLSIEDDFHLKPELFHKKLLTEIIQGRSSASISTSCIPVSLDDVPPSKPVLLDVRNYYEHRVGRFESAICPNLRKFKSFPNWVRNHEQKLRGRDIYMYCTGGVRCEKMGRWMKEYLNPKAENRVFMLHGGIDRYFDWVVSNSNAENDNTDLKEDIHSLFQGRNYVFDARQSTSLSEIIEDVSNCPRTLNGYHLTISQCEICQEPCAEYSKCSSINCHLLLLICQNCLQEKFSNIPISCCSDCESMNRDILSKIHEWCKLNNIDEGHSLLEIENGHTTEINQPVLPKSVSGRGRLCSCEGRRRQELNYIRPKEDYYR